MSALKESRRDSRRTTAALIRVRVSRTLSIALAVALTAVLLPAAISLAKTGQLGRIRVVDAITGAATTTRNSTTQDRQDPKAEQHDTPVAQPPAPASDNADMALAQAALPKLKDDRSVAARLSSAPDDRRNSISNPQGNGGSSDTIGADSRRFADYPARTTTPVDDNPSSGDGSSAPDSGKQGGDSSSSDNSGSDNFGSGNAPRDDNSDNNGKGKDDSAKYDTPKPASPTPARAAAPQPATDTPAEIAPAPDSSAATAPATDAGTDTAAITADTRRRFELDPTDSATLIVNVPQGADHITFWARATGADCSPRVAVTVDGEPTNDAAITLNGTDWQSHTITPVPDAGEHVVRVASLGTDPQVGCADATQDVVTIVEPEVGTEGDAAPVDDATATTADGTATTTDAAATTSDATAADTTSGTDNGTVAKNTGDATGATSGTTTDSRRQYTLYSRESVSLAADAASDGSPQTMWLRSSTADCQARVIVSVDDRVQKAVGVRNTDWQAAAVDYQATGTRHRTVIGVLRPKGTCTGTETLTIVEPKAGEEGSATPALPAAPAQADTTTNSSTETTTPSATPDLPAAPSPADTTTNPSTGTTTPAATSNAADSTQNARAQGTTVFEDSFGHESTCAAFEAAGWAQCHEAAADRLSIGSLGGRRAAIMHVADGDVAPLTPTVNPRAQLNSPIISHEGETQLITWGSWIGADFPTSPSWSVFAQWFASPYNGSPRMSFGVKGGRIGLDRDADYNSDRIWSMPLVREQWTDFALKVKWSSNASVGWIELTVNGQQQKFANGQTRMYFATIKSDQGGKVETILTNYRVKGSAAWATVAHSDLRVSTL